MIDLIFHALLIIAVIEMAVLIYLEILVSRKTDMLLRCLNHRQAYRIYDKSKEGRK